MKSGFGDYNIAICIQNMSFKCFKFKMALKMRNKMAAKMQNLHQNGQIATLKLYENY